MGHRQRMDAMLRASTRGRAARDEGKQQDDNPYKPGPWSNHAAWWMGWSQRDNELRLAEKAVQS